MPLLTEEATNPPSITDVSHLWTFDGGLRDIYVLNADIQSWKQFLAFATARPHSFEADGEALPIPDLPGMLSSQDRAYLLAIKAGAVTLNCHFFDKERIEIDIDTREVRGSTEHDDILAFMADMAEQLRKPVILTPENDIENPLVSYEPSASKWRWRTDWKPDVAL